jgi:hypothetical protein
MANAWQGMAGDLAFGTSANYVDGEYEMRHGLKRVTFKDGRPYGHNLVLGRQNRFLNLHFQGSSKRAMPFLTNRYLRDVYGEAYQLQGSYTSVRSWAAELLNPLRASFRA